MRLSSANVIVSKVQGSTMGTVIVKITDMIDEVREVNFYTQRGTESPIGPYPPDIVRRPLPGIYEKDIVLDGELTMTVTVEIVTDNGVLTGLPPQPFDKRSPTAGGGATLLVQDENTPATQATKLLFQGNVVTVRADGVATFNLDGQYEPLGKLHDDRYLRLGVGHQHAWATDITGKPTTLDGYSSSFVGGLTISGSTGQIQWNDRSNGQSYIAYMSGGYWRLY